MRPLSGRADRPTRTASTSAGTVGTTQTPCLPAGADGPQGGAAGPTPAAGSTANVPPGAGRATHVAGNRPGGPVGAVARGRAGAGAGAGRVRLTSRGRLACAGAVVCASLGAVGRAHLAVGLGLGALAACVLGLAEARSLARRPLVRVGWPPPPAVRDDRVILRYAAGLAPAPARRRRRHDGADRPAALVRERASAQGGEPGGFPDGGPPGAPVVPGGPGPAPRPRPGDGLPRGVVARDGRLRGGVIRDALRDDERLLPMTVHSLAARTPPLPRGVWRPVTPRLEFRDRLGLAMAVTPAAVAAADPPEGTAAPAALVVRPLVGPPLPWLAQAARAAGPRRHAVERLPEVHGVRPYVPGDEVRLLDWRTTLRTGLPHVRELASDTPAACAVLLDTGVPAPGSAPGRRAAQSTAARDFEAAVDCAASLAVHALRLGLTVWLAAGTATARRVAPGAGAQDAVLDTLAAVRPQAGQQPGALTRAAAAPLSGALAVLVSSRSPDLWRAALDALSGRFDTVVCVHVRGGDAAAPPHAVRVRGAQLVHVTGAVDLARAVVTR